MVIQPTSTSFLDGKIRANHQQKLGDPCAGGWGNAPRYLPAKKGDRVADIGQQRKA
jgi:hypothetical protein